MSEVAVRVGLSESEISRGLTKSYLAKTYPTAAAVVIVVVIVTAQSKPGQEGDGEDEDNRDIFFHLPPFRQLLFVLLV